MTTTPSTAAKIAALAADCREEARRQGWDGDDAAFELTAADCEWIVGQIGHTPTRAEWADAGWPHVGSAHVRADEDR